jgi:large subunit ribosomal protein L30
MMAEEKKPKETKSMLAVVRIRGDIDIRRTIRDTLKMLGLKKTNHVTILADNPVNRGMIQKVKDFVTWGEIDDATLTALISKWGRKEADNRLEAKEAAEFAKSLASGKTTFKKAGVKSYFRLHPPTKGHAREGIKKPYSTGGVLGYRGKSINNLLAKMAGLKDGKKK